MDIPLAENTRLVLKKENHRYVHHVLRMKSGDRLFLFNNSELEYEAEIEATHKDETVLRILKAERCNRESPIRICIGQGIPKGKKMDDLIPKITELGAQVLTPLLTERSQVQDISPQKLKRWRTIAQQSAQQTGRSRVVEIMEPKTLENFLKQVTQDTKILFYELEEAHSLHQILQQTSSKAFALIIGPEGGLTRKEVDLAIAQGAHVVTLGKRILRTETVAPAVTAILQYAVGDLTSR